MHLSYKSSRKNDWILFFEARNKKEVGDLSRITFVCYYNSPHGYYAVMPTFTKGKQHLIFYAPHFFSRYGKRIGLNLTGIALIKKYFL
jgi:hypothetical protein